MTRPMENNRTGLVPKHSHHWGSLTEQEETGTGLSVEVKSCRSRRRLGVEIQRLMSWCS